MADVIATVRSALSDEVVGGLAKAFKEEPDALRRGFDAAVPGVLGGLTAKSRTVEGASEVSAALRDAQVAPALLAELPARLDGVKLRGRASGLGVRTLGEPGLALARQVTDYAAIKPSTSSSMVDLTVPLVLAAVAKGAGDVGDVGRLRGFLVGQDAAVRRALPAGFEAFAGVAPGEASPPAAPASRAWLWALPAVLVAAAVIFLVWRGLSHAPPAQAPTSSPPASSAAWNASHASSAFRTAHATYRVVYVLTRQA